MPTVANTNSHKFGKQCGMYVAKMQDFAQKQTPGFVISVTKKVHKKFEPKIYNGFIIVKQIYMFLFELINVYISGFFDGYVVMSKELEIFPFPSFIFSQLPLNIQTKIFNMNVVILIHESKTSLYDKIVSHLLKLPIV
jgi:hypothetical protein